MTYKDEMYYMCGNEVSTLEKTKRFLVARSIQKNGVNYIDYTQSLISPKRLNFWVKFMSYFQLLFQESFQVIKCSGYTCFYSNIYFRRKKIPPLTTEMCIWLEFYRFILSLFRNLCKFHLGLLWLKRSKILQFMWTIWFML